MSERDNSDGKRLIGRRGLLKSGAAAGAAAAGAAVGLGGAGAARADHRGDHRPVGRGFEPGDEAPDLLLVDGRIHTMDDRGSVARHVAIKDGMFVHVGDRRGRVGPGTRVIDLGGRTVIPGIIEPHVHVVSMFNRPGHHTVLENTTNLDEIQEVLARRAAEVPEGEWITSMGGFHPNQWNGDPRIDTLPTLDQIEAAAPNHPVLLHTRFTGPSATNRLGKAFFDARDADIANQHPNAVPVNVSDQGFIASGGFGVATPATTALFYLREIQTFEDKLRTTRETMAYSASVGETYHSDKVLFPTPGPLHPAQVLSNLDHYRMYDSVRELHRRGETLTRLEINFLHNQSSELTELEERLRNQFQLFGDDMLHTGGIGEWAAPLNSPLWFESQRMVAEAGWRNENAPSNLAGLQQVVEGWEALIDVHGFDIADKRYVVHHLDQFTTDLLDRLRDLGAGVAMAAFRWVTSSNPASVAGVRFRDIVEHGIKAGLQGDGVHIAPLNPWLHLYYVVTGLNSFGDQVNPDQQLGRDEALRLFTRENAWFLTRGDKVGTIEKGKLADLAVLDRDYFSVGDEEIKQIRSDLTIVGGKIVHQR